MAASDRAFDTAPMAAALPKTNDASGTEEIEHDEAGVRSPEDEASNGAKAGGPPSGWVPKTSYNYKAYAANPGDETEGLDPDVEATTWAANAMKYEWNDEFGDIGPEHPELEKQLFGDDHLVRTGLEFQKIKDIEVVQEGKVRINPIKKFEDAGLHPIMLQNVKLCRYDVCTPIQAYCIPAILQGYDIFASAQTGSGKTAAFLVPILSKLMGRAKTLAAARPNPATFNPATDAVRAEPLVVIVAPTRELATQIFDEARRFCYRSMLRPSVVYGGPPIREQIADLQRGCDIIIGTPGRMSDIMDRTHVLSFRRVLYTVVDEADEMLDSDWEEHLRKIMHGGDNNPDEDHAYLMFSATFPRSARELAREFLSNDHVRIRVGRPGSTHENVKQKIIYVDDADKNKELYDLLISCPPARTIVFVNSKRAADAVDDYLFNLDLPSTSIHADRTQREREDALRAFRRGRAPILVATGVSARGLDIRDVMHVINYDLPSTGHGGIHDYIHRIGRTARIGNTGLATSFYNEKNEDLAPLLVKTLLETKQDVPDFLESFLPTGENGAVGPIDFEDDSDKEGEGEAGTNQGNGDQSDPWGAATSKTVQDPWGTAATGAAQDPWSTATSTTAPATAGDEGSAATQDPWATATADPTQTDDPWGAPAGGATAAKVSW